MVPHKPPSSVLPSHESFRAYHIPWMTFILGTWPLEACLYVFTHMLFLVLGVSSPPPFLPTHPWKHSSLECQLISQPCAILSEFPQHRVLCLGISRIMLCYRCAEDTVLLSKDHLMIRWLLTTSTNEPIGSPLSPCSSHHHPMFWPLWQPPEQVHPFLLAPFSHLYSIKRDPFKILIRSALPFSRSCNHLQTWLRI